MAGLEEPLGGGPGVASEPMPEALLSILRRRIAVVVLILVTLPVIAVGVSMLGEDSYEASAALLLGDPNADRKSDEFGLPATDPVRAAETGLDLLRLDRVAELASEQLGGSIDAETITDSLDIDARPGSDLVEVRAEAADPETAAAIANAVSDAYVAFRERNDDLAAGEASVVERADPPGEPSSPRPLFSAFLGLALAIPVAFGAAVLLEKVDSRVRNPALFAAVAGVPVVGEIPAVSVSRWPWGAKPAPVPAEAVEAFAVVAAKLGIDRGAEAPSVVVSSAGPGDGKTTVALGIAAAVAHGGRRPLLIEADMRRPALQDVIGAGSAPRGNLAQVLQGAIGPPAAITSIAGPAIGLDRRVVFDAILAGPPSDDAGALIGSGRMRELLEWARAEYEIVVVDSPPAGGISDAIVLAGTGLSVLLVGRVGHTRLPEFAGLCQQFDQVGARVDGIVANCTEGPRRTYYDYLYAERVPRPSPILGPGRTPPPAPASAGVASPGAANGVPAASEGSAPPAHDGMGQGPEPDGGVAITFEQLRAEGLGVERALTVLELLERSESRAAAVLEHVPELDPPARSRLLRSTPDG